MFKQFKYLILLLLGVIIIALFFSLGKKNAEEIDGAKRVLNRQGDTILSGGMPTISAEKIEKCNQIVIDKRFLQEQWLSGASEGGGNKFIFNEDGTFLQVNLDGELIENGEWDLLANRLSLSFIPQKSTYGLDLMIDYYLENPRKDFTISKKGRSYLIRSDIIRSTDTGYANECMHYFRIGGQLYYRETR